MSQLLHPTDIHVRCAQYEEIDTPKSDREVDFDQSADQSFTGFCSGS
jgi:hypothetical protein